tara:strand:+ start:8720 stop:8842 length:123 start_codon:yes stop_codon:yes gene_type:complete
LYRDYPEEKLKVFRERREATQWLGQEEHTDDQALWTYIAQ